MPRLWYMFYQIKSKLNQINQASNYITNQSNQIGRSKKCNQIKARTINRFDLIVASSAYHIHRIAYHLFLLPVTFLCCLDLPHIYIEALVPYRINRVLKLLIRFNTFGPGPTTALSLI